MEYNTSIEDVPKAILIIPFLGTVCPVVWANHADIYVDMIDETFLHALQKVKNTLQHFYPKMRFSGEIHAKNIVKSHVVDNSKSMMLFSCGIDSLATYVRHKNENPILVSVHGADIPLADFEAWNTLLESLKSFSDKTGSKLSLIRSNFRSLLHDMLLTVCYDRTVDYNWYAGVAHGFALLSLCAPIAFKERVGTCYIAASHTKDYPKLWGSHPDIDNNVEWTGTKSVHDAYELSRQQKIKLLADYMKTEGALYIRSCWEPDRGDNCSHCEKCALTILGLKMEGITPNECGYVVDEDTFSRIKQNLIMGKWTIDEASLWEDIQRYARITPFSGNSDLEALILWLQNVNLDAIKQNINNYQPIRAKLFRKFSKYLPDSLYITIRTVWLSIVQRSYGTGYF